MNYDNFILYHKHYINTDKIEKHPLPSSFGFIESLCYLGDKDIYDKCKKNFKTRGYYLISYSLQFFDKYNKDPFEFYSHYLIDRISVT